MKPQLIRNALVAGRRVDIAIADGTIAAIGPDLAGEEWLDARGGAAIPGLHDHHIHLLATAAQLRSIRLEDCADLAAVAARLREAAAASDRLEWLRATGYHERIGGPLDRHQLDRIVPDRPLRVQHQTGGLWMVNSAGIAALAAETWPNGAERDPGGTPSGRFFRCDAWLGARIGAELPDLGALGRQLAAAGVTGVTDASVSTDDSRAALLGAAARDGRLPLRLTLMAGRSLGVPDDGGYTVGPFKILLDDDSLPDPDRLAATIASARALDRRVAVHCVTAGELAITLAAFEQAGSRAGDRIEHGSIIPPEAIPVLRALQLTVVTQPGFIASRGDRYRALVDPAEHRDLYRCASLIAGGVPVAGSSDAPYGHPDPWRGIRAAIERRTAAGARLAPDEALAPGRALGLYLTAADDPGGPPRQLRPGAPADICVLRGPLDQVLADPGSHQVTATLIGGRLSHDAG